MSKLTPGYIEFICPNCHQKLWSKNEYEIKIFKTLYQQNVLKGSVCHSLMKFVKERGTLK